MTRSRSGGDRATSTGPAQAPLPVPAHEVAREPYAVLAGDLGRLRSARAAAMDLRLEQVMADALARHREAHGRVALVAVGGYGRGELSPYSDIDVVLVHEPSLSGDLVAGLADALWYPLWDDGVPLDHAVRDTVSMRDIASRDLRAATGMLDARHVAGEADLSLALRSTVLGDWRRDARARLPELRQACAQRVERAGDLAHAAVPDLKESGGGLRDGAVLRALVATWLVDVPHRAGEAHRSALLDVRDTLHEVAGRRGDRLHPELIPDVAARLGTSPDALAFHVRDLGRRTAHLAQLTWRRLDQVLATPTHRAGPRTSRRPALVRLGGGVASLDGEVVLAQAAHPGDDPWLALRAATAAATNGLTLAPSTAARLAATHPELPDPWPDHARRTAGAPARRGSGSGAGVGGARPVRADRPLAPGVARHPAAPVAVGSAPLHRRPAPGRDLRRGHPAAAAGRPAPTCWSWPRCCTTSASTVPATTTARWARRWPSGSRCAGDSTPTTRG